MAHAPEQYSRAKPVPPIRGRSCLGTIKALAAELVAWIEQRAGGGTPERGPRS